MTKHQGPRCPSEGAKNAVMCALVEPDGFTGELIEDERISSWWKQMRRAKGGTSNGEGRNDDVWKTHQEKYMNILSIQNRC